MKDCGTKHETMCINAKPDKFVSLINTYSDELMF